MERRINLKKWVKTITNSSGKATTQGTKVPAFYLHRNRQAQ